MLDVNNTQAASSISIDLGLTAEAYECDQFFGPFWRALKYTWPLDAVEKERIERMIHIFEIQEGKLHYRKKTCVLRKKVRDILLLAHDSKVAEYMGFAKTFGRLQDFHWKNKSRDIRSYCEGSPICQQHKDHGREKLTDPTPLYIPSRRWGSIGTDFIVGLPKTRSSYGAITTWVNRLTTRVHFIVSRETDTAFDAADALFCKYFQIARTP